MTLCFRRTIIRRFFELSHHGVNKLREVDDIAVDKYAFEISGEVTKDKWTDFGEDERRRV